MKYYQFKSDIYGVELIIKDIRTVPILAGQFQVNMPTAVVVKILQYHHDYKVNVGDRIPVATVLCREVPGPDEALKEIL